MFRRISVLLALLVLGSGLVVAPRAIATDDSYRGVRAGVAVVDATWNVGASAGQYSGYRFQSTDVDPQLQQTKNAPSYGVQSRLHINAIVVEDAEGDRIALVKSDNYLAQDLLVRRVGQLLKERGSAITPNDILYGVTHAHASPYYSTPSWGVWLFQDVMDLRMFEYQARKMADAIAQAEADLRPARMSATTVHYSSTQRNAPAGRVGNDGSPAGYPLEENDHGLVVMRFDDISGDRPEPLAAWMNFGQHPESLNLQSEGGYNLISGDWVAPLERFVQQRTGVPLVFSQGGVGSAEQPRKDNTEVLADGTVRAFAAAGHAQAERNAHQMAKAFIQGWQAIGEGDGLVPYSNDFDVEALSVWVPGPASHPYPSVSNCSTEPTVEGNPGMVIVPGLPTCSRAQGVNNSASPLVENLKAHGIPVPDHYGAPGFTGVEENNRLLLQAFRLGEVLLSSCACEAQSDLILNFESRADDVEGNVYDGFDWSQYCDPNADGTYRCADPRKVRYHSDADHDRSLTVTKAAYDRMVARLHNDASGWDALENAVAANSEPSDTTQIWGNFTKTELPASLGYKLPVGIGHAGDYNGYTVSYIEYMNGDEYRQALTSHGPHTADYMATRMMRLAGQLKGGPVYDVSTEPMYAAAVADEARQEALAQALGRASAAAYDGWFAQLPDDAGEAAPLVQPNAEVPYFSAATFTWRGGNNFVDNPTVVIERFDEGEWVRFAGASDEVQTLVEFPKDPAALAASRTGSHEWKWTASFEVFRQFPLDLPQIPTGTYRFVAEGNQSRGGAAVPYRVESQAFDVVPWNELEVTEIRYDSGEVRFRATAEYPRTYASPFRHIKEDDPTRSRANRLCFTCTFRPWAGAVDIMQASVRVERADGSVENVRASNTGTEWVASVQLLAGDRAYIAPGQIVDRYGQTIRVNSPVVTP